MLSFQLCVDGRVVIDPGMPTYEQGAERDWFRGTRAHSTISADGRDQFELWGAFRSGPLPRVELREVTNGDATAFVDWPAGVRRVRRIALDDRNVRVQATVEGSGRRTVADSLLLAPNASPTITASGSASAEHRRIIERLYSPVPMQALVVREERCLPATSGWTVELR